VTEAPGENGAEANGDSEQVSNASDVTATPAESGDGADGGADGPEQADLSDPGSTPGPGPIQRPTIGVALFVASLTAAIAAGYVVVSRDEGRQR
jgi:hypothetical protein